ncbi:MULTISPECIES: SRPBCC family protein [unclassified Arcicella]|uniref:SRPBCC family protein n=1 Tax=unclassified Arcicella TaxID=2644986 RepID=UPI0028627DD9|nr:MULTISPECIES: SRPBCC family protein [unclassified Arcicella]MDR6560370.1 ligand-binding SRPBCC domain-containing protein [Arcicella sp. BE51]MDR6810024.1 ligand-binding SRPBCC domain-containing protein [Arcicella sp. BE140]MDR6821373.1 ligand-binding SRPBCC domain-containing protein [Arcicella sp. BE139]
MPKITLETIIQSDIEICFDLARSIDLHKISTAHTNENAIDGTTTGLINLGETVTWEAKHFGIKQQLTSIITAFSYPNHFRDEQLKGIFKSFVHNHSFEVKDENVIMTDVFIFESPYGILGEIFNKVILTKYLTKLLADRNKIIKEYAESDLWKLVLNRK